MSRKLLLVEGPDDSNAVFHVLRRHGVSIADRGRAFPERLVLEDGQGIERILESLPLRIQAMMGEDPPVRLGLVLDADRYPDRRWQAIGDRLRMAGYTLVPDAPDPDGTLVIEAGFPIIGIWLMPNNQMAGALEEFAHLLIAPTDRLWTRAMQVVQDIPPDDRRFGEHDSMKAMIHTWLAWQEEPGKPIGQAMTKRYLDTDAVVAQQFVTWVRRLFDDMP